MKHEIYFNKKTNEYTLNEEVEGQKCIKKKPLKYKSQDSTAKFRKQILKEKLLGTSK